MNLHSINQETKKAIIEHQGQLIEVEWERQNGWSYLNSKSWDMLLSEGVDDPGKAGDLIREYLASAPKVDQNVRKMNEETRKLCGLPTEKYSSYKINVSDLNELDIYELHNRFKINDHSGCIQHASKKLLLAGTRTGGKSKAQDIKEARDTLNRWLDINSK